MADQEWRTESAVADLLRREPYRFEFFQAVRLLLQQTWNPANGEQSEAAPRLGQEGALAPPRIRFGAVSSLAFPAAEIADFADPEPQATGAAASPRMRVAFLGLTGPGGVLPDHYTTLLMERGQSRHTDYTLQDFLDIFNQRALSLFFRAWGKHFPPWQYEQYRRDQTEQEDLFTFGLRCLVGLGTAGLRDRLRVDDEAIFYYAGHFSHFPRPAVSLEELLGDYFELPVRVTQFCGRWLNLSLPDRSCLPTPVVTRGQNRQLSNDLVLGTRVWDVQTKFRIRIGPLNYVQFRDFLPGRPGLQRLCDLVRLFVGQQLEFDVQLVLRQAEIPRAGLTFQRPSARRLGWDCWLKLKEFTQDSDCAIFRERTGGR